MASRNERRVGARLSKGFRDIGSQQTSGRINMQPSGLMNIYSSPSCLENARSCRESASWRVANRQLWSMGDRPWPGLV